MSDIFTFEGAGRIVFGSGALRRIGDVLEQVGVRTCLVISDGNLSGPAEVVRAAAEARGISCAIFAGGEPEPTAELVGRAVEAGARNCPDGVVGLGGGSNIDVAKAVAAVLVHGGPIGRYAGANRIPGPGLPLVAVPTTAGSGSEVSGACILRNHGGGAAMAVVDSHLRPRIALVDPELHLSCPRTVTRDSGIDALTHAIEAYTMIDASSFPHAPDVQWPIYQGRHPLTDVLAERAIELIARALPRAVATPHDLAARTDMALGALLAGLAMSNTGIATAHALAYPVGTFTHASHGACNGALLPAVMDFIAPSRPREMQRIADLMGTPGERAADAVRELLRRIGAPATLRELGLAADLLESTAEIAFGIRRLMDGSPRPATAAELRAIVRCAWEGA